MHKIRVRTFLLINFLTVLFSCATKDSTSEEAFPAPAAPSSAMDESWDAALTKEIYYDKVLGMLVGSAIGDAMGAPTEMWHRDYIVMHWGHVDSMDMVLREGSPEGTWEDNLPSGSTTDDTRWKYLTGKFLVQNGGDSLDAKQYAAYIMSIYEKEMQEVKNVESFEPEPMERQLMHMAWLQEWAKVAKPYIEGDIDSYSYALNRFYGGEMTCAGMLYTPVVGAFYPAQSEKAYQEAYRLGIFDLGYARDISALTGAMVSTAMKPGIPAGDIIKVHAHIDPLRYYNSRLIGRAAFNVYRTAVEISYKAKSIDSTNLTPVKLKNWKQDPLYYRQVQKAYELLDEHLQDAPFHAAEIHIINLVALEFSQGDFRKALEFVVNYGRDNDTVAAITGAILGAHLGYKALPTDLAQKALSVNTKVLGLDLQELAKQLVEKGYRGR